jgi:arylsulfatase A-like enzyme
MRFACLLAAVFFSSAVAPPRAAADRPNILWIYVEDMNGWMSCYGDKLVATPNIDSLAERGVRFDRAYMPAGVCSATRSGVITGTMQTTFGLHNHRSSRSSFRGQSQGKNYGAVHLPAGVKTVPELFKAAGYFTFNQGKTDYNFVFNYSDLYDGGSGSMRFKVANVSQLWKKRKKGQPFFGQIQLRGGKNTGRVNPATDAAKVAIMPYYPDHPIVRDEIAHHYNCIRQTDDEVGQIVAALKRDELFDNTVLLFFTDHGFRMLRHKQFLYEGGIRVPLIVTWQGKPRVVRRGLARDDLVSGIDLGPTSLALAGIEVPDYMEGRHVFAADYQPRPFVVAARDRCDYTIERIRAVVTPRFKYLKNFMTDRPYMQPQYRDGRNYTTIMKQLYRDGKLNAAQSHFMAPDRPAEELYDLSADPHETINLAADAAFAPALKRHREILNGWIKTTGDKGQYPESEAGLRAVLLRWGAKCVNPEYDKVREK